MILIKAVTLVDKVLPSGGKSLFTYMYTRLKNLSRFGVWSLIVTKSASSFAQSDSSGVDAETIALEDILVVGKRASLASAQEIKRNKMEIVDSVVADDINKLPDINVTDALSRFTGVQILRDRGEGAGVAIRGLTQMETLLNGWEVFTAGSGRNLDFADISSEMLEVLMFTKLLRLITLKAASARYRFIRVATVG